MKPRWTLEASRLLVFSALAAPSCAESDGESTATKTIDRICQIGDTRLCFGPGACEGAQVCLETGAGFGKCDCGKEGDAGLDLPEGEAGGSSASTPSNRGGGNATSGGNGGDAPPGNAGGSTGGNAGNATLSGGRGGDQAGGTSGEAAGAGGQPASSECGSSPVADDTVIAARLETLLGTRANVLERAANEGWSLASAADRERLFDAVWAEPETLEQVVNLQLEHFQLARRLPDLDEVLAASFSEEARLVVSSLTESQAPLSDYYTTRDSYFDAAVAAAYGAPVPISAWEPSVLPEERQGVLLLGAWLASHRGPSLRGNALRQIRTCGSTPEHPPGFSGELVLEPTTRDAYLEGVSSQAACAVCHVMMDPMGFGFLAFDDTGAYRTEENGYPIDATGELFPENEPFDGALELNALLADEPETTRCLATRLVERAAIGTEQVNCRLQSLLAPLGASSSFRDVLRAVITSELVTMGE